MSEGWQTPAPPNHIRIIRGDPDSGTSLSPTGVTRPPTPAFHQAGPGTRRAGRIGTPGNSNPRTSRGGASGAARGRVRGESGRTRPAGGDRPTGRTRATGLAPVGME